MDLLNRLQNITKKNKDASPKLLSDVIKSDFFYLISNYFEVNFDEIEVRVTTKDTKYIVQIDCLGDRLKLMRSIPE